MILNEYEALNKDGIREPYVACGCCGKGLARNWLKARDPIWKRCPDCIKIHGPEGLSALVPQNTLVQPRAADGDLSRAAAYRIPDDGQ